MDLYTRVCRAIVRITAAEAGRDVIAVGHGGTIKAAVGLALGGQPESGLAFDIDNVLGDAARSYRKRRTPAAWRLPMVNQQPWIADATACRDAPAGRTGSRAGEQACLTALCGRATTA